MTAAIARPIAGLTDNAIGVVDNVASAVGDDAVRNLNPFALSGRQLDDFGTAARRVEEAIERIQGLVAQHGDGPWDDATMAATKDARIGVKNVSLEAQARIQPHIAEGVDTAPTIFSKLKQADANLEDMGWQLAKKPSPDGRFNGVDLPGALNDGRNAAAVLRELVPLPAAADGIAPPIQAIA